MDPKAQQQKRQDNTLSLLNAAIEAMNLAKEVSSGTPAKAVFGTVSVILTMIRVRFLLPQVVYSSFSRYQDSMANKSDYVELGLACANVCKALHRGMGEKKLDDLSPSVREAIEQLTTWVKPVIHTLHGSPTMLLIAELWRRSRIRSPRSADGMHSLVSSTPKATKKRSGLGGWT